MELLEKQPTDLDTGKPPRMTHLLDLERGFPYCLCGYVAEKIVKVRMSTSEQVDCVVCEELWEGKFGV